MELPFDLNTQQQIAVDHGAGPALVLAGAGSGKTRVITYRIARLIRTGACRPENILAVTFTNKAADEMRERVHGLIGPSRIAEPHISTFHSFCVRVLRREIHLLGYRRDFSIYDTDDQKRLMKRLISEAGLRESDLTPREVLSRISYAKNHRTQAHQYSLHFKAADAEDIAELYSRYESRLHQSNALDFDDLLLKAVELLEEHPGRKDHYSDWYRFILVDEYQDTNRPQYEILRLLTSRHRNLFVVGDEDQSIYRFRGADIQNILRFEKDFPGARVIKLEQNYRSTQNILQVAGAVVAKNQERKGKILWTQNPSGDLVTFHTARSARSEANRVCRCIKEILEEKPEIRIAVLYRANFLSRNFEEVLREHRVPYAVVGSVAFFGRMEVKDMLAYLRIIYNPEDDIALLRIINTPPRAIGQTTIDLLIRTAAAGGCPLRSALAELSRDPARSGRAHRALAAFQSLLDGWASIRDTASTAELLRNITRDVAYREMLERQESREEAESRMANVEELIRAALESRQRGETVFEFLDRASLASEIDSLDSSARVVLMTVHSAKGLEFDVVFLVGLEEGLFPHSLSVESPQDLEEERRLCYVAITRARHKLFLSWTPMRRAFGTEGLNRAKPSRFLEEMPHHLIDGVEMLPAFVREDVTCDEFADMEEDEDYDYSHARRATPQQDADQPEQESPKTLAELRSYLKRVTAVTKPGRAFKSGMRVRHAQFGDGIVLSRQKVGDEFRLVVSFSSVGRKTLVERYAKLETL